jgi:hypothetical protein
MILPDSSAALRVWSGVGPLVGVLIGGWITYRIQSQQWLANNRKEEYRELLTVLTSAALLLMEDAQMKTGVINVNQL